MSGTLFDVFRGGWLAVTGYWAWKIWDREFKSR